MSTNRWNICYKTIRISFVRSALSLPPPSRNPPLSHCPRNCGNWKFRSYSVDRSDLLQALGCSWRNTVSSNRIPTINKKIWDFTIRLRVWNNIWNRRTLRLRCRGCWWSTNIGFSGAEVMKRSCRERTRRKSSWKNSFSPVRSFNPHSISSLYSNGRNVLQEWPRTKRISRRLWSQLIPVLLAANQRTVCKRFWMTTHAIISRKRYTAHSFALFQIWISNLFCRAKYFGYSFDRSKISLPLIVTAGYPYPVFCPIWLRKRLITSICKTSIVVKRITTLR